MPLRQKLMMSKSSKEYAECLKVVSYYAIEYPHVSFVVKKKNANTSSHGLITDLHTKGGESCTTQNVIEQIFGSSFARSLLPVDAQSLVTEPQSLSNNSKNNNNRNNSNAKNKIALHGYIGNGDTSSHSNASNAKKHNIQILFINHRLVIDTEIRKCIHAQYEAVIPKFSSENAPFVFLSIEIPSHLMDVNVHPTKKEVKFLFSDILIQLLQDTLGKKLKESNHTRIYTAESLQHLLSRQERPEMNMSAKKPLNTKHESNNESVGLGWNANVNVNVNANMNMSQMASSNDKRKDNENTLTRMPAFSPIIKKEHAFEEAGDATATKIGHDNIDAGAETGFGYDDNNGNGNDNNNNNGNGNNKDNSNGGSRGNDVNGDDDIDIVNFSTNANANRSGYETKMESNSDDDMVVEPTNIKMDSTRQEVTTESFAHLFDERGDELYSFQSESKQGNHDSFSQERAQKNVVSLDLSEKINKQIKPKQPKEALVRTDNKQGNLHWYWQNRSGSSFQGPKTVTKSPWGPATKHNNMDVETNQVIAFSNMKNEMSQIFRSNTFVQVQRTSQKQINCSQKYDEMLMDVFHKSVFVGCVDGQSSFRRVMFQHSTKLYLCDAFRISRVFFFEWCVRNVGQFPYIYTLQGCRIYELLLLALDLPESECCGDIKEKAKVAQNITQLLSHPAIAEALKTHFAIEIEKNDKTPASLSSLPCFAVDYMPPLLYLPVFLLRLGTQVQWFENQQENRTHSTSSTEVELSPLLFKQVALEIARFYQIRPPQFYPNNPKEIPWIIEHLLFRNWNKTTNNGWKFHPPTFLRTDGSLLQLACTKQLYKVFERC
ncbi:DNA mismatch repair protein Mlh1 [Reticulomyxa filosa]|uniref:DNA mismatch repair protein Mlh1 n=1 Tax=Reticulomyxa filosa TaxID=46433 RepID=X6NP26_RETFI|nr:DNA mismatch repair protein Mlh1 [Reticulomyxa filosa]|eukprot:ETO27776.1 DNA mismatch repair protein Mlh1 [Reticulomyxa filosa]